MGALVGLGVWLLFAFQPKDTISPSDNKKVSNILSSVKLVISDDSFKKINDTKSLEVALSANDSALIASVDYVLDDNVVGRSIEAPFVVTISLNQLAPGEHTLQAVAYDMKGGSVKSKIFTFTIQPNEVIPSDESSSDMISSLPRKKIIATTVNAGGTQNSGNDQGGSGNNEEDPDDPGTPQEGIRTAGGWWASLPSRMQVCSNGVLNTGPAAAPAGAITVPAGDNKNFNFNQDNKTFWFAPGVHTLNTPPNTDNSDIYGGIVPGNGSTYIGAPGAVIDGDNEVMYAFKGTASNVRIAYLEIRNFGRGMDNMNEGVVNHDSGTGWVMEYLSVHNNDGAAVFVGSQNIVRYNCLKDNGQYGFSMFKPPINGDSAIKDIVLDHNEISGNNQDDWENQPGLDGCGCTGAGKFWDVKGATVTNNYVHDNLSTGLWADTNDIDFLFDSNWIEHNNGEGIWYEISYNATISRNVFKRNAWTTGQNNTGSPGPAIYISESGGDSRLQSSVSGSTNLQIKNNLLEDNFSGVSIYENSNRFCNSHGNTSTGYCTPFVNPTTFEKNPEDSSYPDPVSDVHPCYTQLKNAPYTTNCRWHSKNVQVFNNEFRFDDTVVPCAGGYCGVQALFATGSDNMNGGTYGSWVPAAYNISAVQNNVMFNNNNKFFNNTYVGRWKFAKGYGERISFGTWQAGPYLQDVGSTYSAPPVENYLNTDTSTIEGSTGLWEDWYNTSVTRSTLEAHTGSHSLQVAIGDPFWAAHLNSSVDVNPGPKKVSYWIKKGVGPATLVKMTVQWIDELGNTLSSTQIPLTPSSTWQQGTANATAPAGTVRAFIILSNESGSSGSTFFVDDFIIGDAP